MWDTWLITIQLVSGFNQGIGTDTAILPRWVTLGGPGFVGAGVGVLRVVFGVRNDDWEWNQ